MKKYKGDPKEVVTLARQLYLAYIKGLPRRHRKTQASWELAAENMRGGYMSMARFVLHCRDANSKKSLPTPKEEYSSICFVDFSQLPQEAQDCFPPSLRINQPEYSYLEYLFKETSRYEAWDADGRKLTWLSKRRRWAHNVQTSKHQDKDVILRISLNSVYGKLIE